MTNDKAITSDLVGASMVSRTGVAIGASGGGEYHVQCFDKDGNLKWEDQGKNLVVNAGLKDMNDKYFAGSAYTAAWYVGLIVGPGASNTYIAGDTLPTHAGWTEFVNYSGSRKAAVFSASTTADPSVISNSASPASFTISGAGGVVAGAFLGSVATGTAGILFSEANFQSPGDRTVVAGDVLNVTYTFSLDAA